MKQIMNEQLTLSNSLPLRARSYDYRHFTYPWHFHSEYEIIYIKEGEGTRFVGNSIDAYAAGDVLLIGPNLPHYMKSDERYHADHSELRVRGTIIQFEKDFMYHAINHYPHFVKIRKMLAEAHCGICFPSALSTSAMRRLLETIPEATGIDQITAFLQLLEAMAETRGRQLIASADFAPDALHDTSRIDKVIAYLNKQYNRSIHLDEVASFAAMNPTAFCRFFKDKTGKTFKQYVLDMRTGYACKLLLMNDMNISQISIECGFDTISHFNKVFKRGTGYTPSQYKLLMLNE